MLYESVQKAAERLGVSVRAVQKWAASGKLYGAIKEGRDWRIPTNATGPSSAPAVVSDVYDVSNYRECMPLMNSAYHVGKCLEYIDGIEDGDDRNIALGEYYFFSGNGEKAAQYLEPYFYSHDPALRYSANLIGAFANISRGHIHLAKFALKNLRDQVTAGLQTDSPPKLHALGIFTATTTSVLLHLPLPHVPPLEEHIRYLPGGIKLWACYILAHQAYLNEEYERCVAISDMGLALCPDNYPIASIYVHLSAAMGLMNLKKVETAKEHIADAWAIAEPDGILEPFGEHHGLLQGLIEIFFKKNYPHIFERIISITYAFSAGWRKIHNPGTNDRVTDDLTTTEFTVAMLYNKNWSAQEIAGYMGISEHTVRGYIKTIYTKLNISGKSSLAQYLLK